MPGIAVLEHFICIVSRRFCISSSLGNLIGRCVEREEVESVFA